MNILSSLLDKVRKDFVIAITMFSAVVATNASAINVAVSIPPLAGMIAPIMGENDSVDVILKPGTSPHGFQMKPSNLKTLQQSDLVVWVGTPVDWWMEKPLHNLQSKQLAMHDLSGLQILPVRKGGLWESHSHHDHGHDSHGHDSHGHDNHGHDNHGHDNHGHDNHGHDNHGHDNHGHDNHGHDNHGHDNQGHDNHGHDNHGHDKHVGHSKHYGGGSKDGHLWMSYQNSVLLIKAFSAQLQKQYPQRASEFKANTQAWLTKLMQKESEIAAQLKDVNRVPFMVLHDAYQYFEHHYQLNGVGSIQLNPGVAPSLKRVEELRQKVKNGEIRCIFREPQFPERRVFAVTKGMQINLGMLDPMGSLAAQEQNSAFLPYDMFMEELANQFHSCLSK